MDRDADRTAAVAVDRLVVGVVVVGVAGRVAQVDRGARSARAGRLAGAVSGKSCLASGLRAPSEVACATSCWMP